MQRANGKYKDHLVGQLTTKFGDSELCESRETSIFTQFALGEPFQNLLCQIPESVQLLRLQGSKRGENWQAYIEHPGRQLPVLANSLKQKLSGWVSCNVDIKRK